VSHHRPTPDWPSLPDSHLLDRRLCDLKLSLKNSPLQPAIDQLHAELHSRRIRFRPHFWISNEWFAADNIPGIAVPFYLAHPRLTRLERSQMLDVEGGTHDWAMRILRHECGHAIDNAYRLHRRRRYRQLFGPFAAPYPDSYRPRPYTKDFVIHLDMWYAQAHPAEDFAETFAVWLNPNSHWRDHYHGWPALRKLQYVDSIINEIAAQRPPVTTRRRHRPLSSLKITLREHYRQKREYYCRDHPRFYDRDLRRLFSADAKHVRRPAAGAFLQSIRPEARMLVSRWTGESQFTIDRTLADMIRRVADLKLRLTRPPQQTKTDVLMMLAVQTMNYLNDGKHRLAL